MVGLATVLYVHHRRVFFQNLNRKKLQSLTPLCRPGRRRRCSARSSVLAPAVLGQDRGAIRVLPATWHPSTVFAGIRWGTGGWGCGRGRTSGTLMSYAATPNGPAVTRVQYTIRDLHPHGAG